MPIPEPPNYRHSAKRGGLHARDALLLIPVLGLLIPGIYARRDPMLFGFPFFYWYQFAWVPIGAALTMIVFVLRRRSSPAQGKPNNKSRIQ